MGIYIIVLLAFGLALLWAVKIGSKTAQLEALKAEIKRQTKEQERAEKIRHSVFTMDEHTVRRRLHKIANQQR